MKKYLKSRKIGNVYFSASSINLKTAVEVIKTVHASILRQAQGSGSTRTVFATLTQLVSSPFAMSAAASVAVEGIRGFQLPLD